MTLTVVGLVPFQQYRVMQGQGALVLDGVGMRLLMCAGHDGGWQLLNTRMIDVLNQYLFMVDLDIRGFYAYMV